MLGFQDLSIKIIEQDLRVPMFRTWSMWFALSIAAMIVVFCPPASPCSLKLDMLSIYVEKERAQKKATQMGPRLLHLTQE